MKLFKIELKHSLSRDQIRQLTGSGVAGPQECGTCSHPNGVGGRSGCYKQVGGETDGQCRCMYQRQECG